MLMVVVGAGLLIAGVVRLVGRGRLRSEQDDLRERAGRDVARRADQAWKQLLLSRETVTQVGVHAQADLETIRATLTG